jgi:hypothetical protein
MHNVIVTAIEVRNILDKCHIQTEASSSQIDMIPTIYWTNILKLSSFLRCRLGEQSSGNREITMSALCGLKNMGMENECLQSN